MTPGDMLLALDHALARGRRGKYRLILTAPLGLGETGAHVEGEGYGYTKRQCRRMRRAILDAARHDRLAAPAPAPYLDPDDRDAPAMRDDA